MIDWQTRQFWPRKLCVHLATFSRTSIWAASLSVAATLKDLQRGSEHPQQSHWIVSLALRTRKEEVAFMVVVG